ncbi:hypothetical protein [Polycladomyces subterraneus]|uniref:DUF5348 domain-containing protein n=1 Tax=Polycladomyces subterraneus TaxID=1016997 RepID=A0ABT8IMK0_9BACL|nr:hypothetical protein [Polycladomyces subterraneus]MDN4593996.1 hypothetical protein [Polycladomyces subterraneus]
MTDKLNEIKKELDSILPKLKKLAQTIEELLSSSGFGDDDEKRFMVKEYRYLGSLLDDMVTYAECLAREWGDRGVTDKLNKIKKDLDSILPKLKQLSKIIEDLPSSGFGNDDEERLLVKEYRYLGSLMDDIVTHAEYLTCDVVAEGYLRLNENGRYQCLGIELQTGSIMELYIYSESMEQPEWMVTRLAYTREKGYHALDYPDLELNGVRARIRR